MLRHEEFGDELFDVGCTRLAALPLFVDAFEHSVGVVKLSRLKLDHPLRILSQLEANHIARAAVMGAKEEFWAAIWRLSVSSLEVI